MKGEEGEEKGSVRRSVHWGCHDATTWMLRLILNAAALEAARPILLFRDWRKAARLKRNASVW